ncbi:MAG TPA: molybdate ABC transporter substrate-binding protein [Jatrophihabitans sp.]
MRRRIGVLLAVAALTPAACSSSGGSSAPGSAHAGGSAAALSGSITVFAASSLTEAFTTLGQQFDKAHPGAHVGFDFDSSSTLAASIQQGQPADVFASASPTNMATVVSSGQVNRPQNFTRNQMEIATPPGNPAGIKTVADLAKPGVKVALCDAAVPCGATAEKVFQNAHVTVRATASEPDVKSTIGVVTTKEVDAGMVYVTDVRAAGKQVTGVPIPSSVNASTTYPIATVKAGAHHELAQAWVAYVLSPAGRKVLAADGFLSP